MGPIQNYSLYSSCFILCHVHPRDKCYSYEHRVTSFLYSLVSRNFLEISELGSKSICKLVHKSCVLKLYFKSKSAFVYQLYSRCSKLNAKVSTIFAFHFRNWFNIYHCNVTIYSIFGNSKTPLVIDSNKLNVSTLYNTFHGYLNIFWIFSNQ